MSQSAAYQPARDPLPDQEQKQAALSYLNEAWAEARKLLAARPVLVLSPLSDTTPAAGFLRAWADFGLDTAKTRGTFKAAIPRPNLLKFPG